MRQVAILTTLFACSPWAAPAARAQDEAEPDVQWAYASFFGTGWYRIDDQRSAFIVRGTPRWKFGEAGFDADGGRRIGYQLRLPLTLGLNQFDVADIPGLIDPENFATASVNVGFDADIPVNRRLSLRPNAELGWGTVLNDSESAWVYRAEIRGRYRFRPDDVGWTLHAAAGYAGHTPDVGNSENFNYVSFAAERGHETGWRTKEGERIRLHWQLGYTDFLDTLGFGGRSASPVSVGNYWQFDVSFARPDRPLRVWRMNFDRLGLGYSISPSGEHRAVRFVFRSFYEL